MSAMRRKDLASFYRNRKILVTGHTGFKGAWLAATLQRWGARVVGAALPPHTEPNLFTILGLGAAFPSRVCDVKDFSGLRKVFADAQPEIVMHLAAQALVREGYRRPLETFATNTLGTANVLEAVRITPSVRAAVIVTTDKVYAENQRGVPYREGDALGGRDPYSASKAAADIISHSYIASYFAPERFGSGHAALVATARAGNTVGGGDWAQDRLLPDIMRSRYHNHPLVVRSPEHVRPWQYVLDCLSGYLILGRMLREGEKKAAGAWNFGPDTEDCLSVAAVLERVGERAGAASDSPDGGQDTMREAPELMLDSSRARELLGWRPRFDFDRTIASTLAWYQEYYESPHNIRRFTHRHIDSFFSA